MCTGRSWLLSVLTSDLLALYDLFPSIIFSSLFTMFRLKPVVYMFRRSFSVSKEFYDGLAVPPKAVDVLITDISEEDLLAIAGNFKIERLKPPPPNFLITYPIKGRLFGWNNRIFFPMVIKKGEKKIALPMLYDTGSQYTFLRDDTLRALGIKGDIPMGAQVQINEFPNIRIFLSHSHFHNVDVLGQEFMMRFGLEVLIAPSVLKAKLMKVDPEEWDDSDD